jgi:hypothetical protein
VDLRLGRMDDGRSRGFCHVAYATVEAVGLSLQGVTRLATWTVLGVIKFAWFRPLSQNNNNL